MEQQEGVVPPAEVAKEGEHVEHVEDDVANVEDDVANVEVDVAKVDDANVENDVENVEDSVEDNVEDVEYNVEDVEPEDNVEDTTNNSDQDAVQDEPNVQEMSNFMDKENKNLSSVAHDDVTTDVKDSPADRTVTSTTDEALKAAYSLQNPSAPVPVPVPKPVEIPESKLDVGSPVLDKIDKIEDIELESRRKFRLHSLHYPEALENREIKKIMAECQYFHIWFERRNPGDPKKGGLSVSFDLEQQAKSSFGKVRNLTIASHKVKHQAPKGYWDELAQSEKQNTKEAGDCDHDLSKKLYISQLLPSTQEDLIRPIFGAENLKKIEIKLDPRKRDGSKEAIVTFHSKELADQAREDYDNFSIDDGEVSRPMRILPLEEYLKNVKTSKYGKIEDVTEASSDKKEEILEGVVGQPERTVEEVQDLINQRIIEQRTNWAELNNAQELWQLLDGVCQEHGWVDEDIQREALLQLLQKDIAECSQDWMHNHLQRLIRSWKKECSKPSRSNKSQRSFQLAAPTYQPPIVEAPPQKVEKEGIQDMPKKPNTGSRKKQLMGLMGVGALLAQVKETPPEEIKPVQEEVNTPSSKATSDSGGRKRKIERKKTKKLAKKKRVEKSSESEGEEKTAKDLEDGEMKSGAESSSASSSASSSDSDSSNSDAATKDEDTSDSSESNEDKKRSKNKSNRKERRAKQRKRLERQKKKLSKGKGANQMMDNMMPQMFGIMQQMIQTRMQMMTRPTAPQPQTNQMQQMQLAFQQFQQQQVPATQYAFAPQPAAPFYPPQFQQPAFYRPP